MVNLLLNARDAMGDSGRLEVTLRAKAGSSMGVTLPRVGIDARFSKPTVLPPRVG